MLMRLATLKGSHGVRIPVLVGHGPGTTLLQCREAGPFLKELATQGGDGEAGAGDESSSGLACLRARSVLSGRRAGIPGIDPDIYLKIVFFEGGGAFLQLFDAIGKFSDEIALDEREAQGILERIC